MYYNRINDGVTWPANQPLSETNLSKVESGLATIDDIVAGLRALNNLSFEIDDDNDGVPDGWTCDLFSNGAGALDTANAVHGSKCFALTHPGGAGNGGGQLISGFIPISGYESRQLKFLSFILWSSVAGIKNEVYIYYYDKDRAYIADSLIYSSVANPTTPKIFLSLFPAIPADARFFKIRFIGGDTSVDVAGTTYFDGVEIIQTLFIDSPPAKSVACTLAEASTSNMSYVDVRFALIEVPGYYQYLNLPMQLKFDADVRTTYDTRTAYIRFRIGSAYSNEESTSSIIYVTKAFILNTAGLMEKSFTLYMQLKIAGNDRQAYGRKIDPNTDITFNRSGVVL